MHRIELSAVEKRFHERTAVKKTDLCLESGVYGLLGENGAGKTTLMRMICGVLKPTGGSIRCDGIEISRLGRAYRRLLGYLPQDFGYYGEFSARRFLRYMAALKAMPQDCAERRIDEMLELVDLMPFQKQKLKTFSVGMLRRIGIAQALLNDPEILILDEPTAGLDPRERVRFRNIISSLGKERTVILSTHIVSDVDYIADQIMIMKNGTITAEGTERELKHMTGKIAWKCIAGEVEAERLGSRFTVSNLRHLENGVELRIVSDRRPAPDAEALEPSLEDIYLYLTGEKRGGTDDETV